MTLETQPAGRKVRFKRQPIMEKVLLALLPCALGALYFFGWRSIAKTWEWLPEE